MSEDEYSIDFLNIGNDLEKKEKKEEKEKPKHEIVIQQPEKKKRQKRPTRQTVNITPNYDTVDLKKFLREELNSIMKDYSFDKLEAYNYLLIVTNSIKKLRKSGRVADALKKLDEILGE